jgi:SSS family solute:Na+ symporter
MLGPAFIVSPGLLQKIYGARDDRAVRLGVGANALGLLLYAPIPVILGMIARAQFPTLSAYGHVPALQAHELALPMILMHGVPAAVGAIGLAAVFSAEVSAADAVLFMLTTSLSQDFYRRFVSPAATDHQLLRVTRVTAVCAGALGVLVGLAAETIINALSIFYTVLSVSLFVPIVAALYSRRAGSAEALAAIAAGIAVVAALQLSYSGGRVFGITPAMFGLAASVVAFGTVTVLRRGTVPLRGQVR